MAESSKPKIQCPCGRFIESPADYKLLYLKKEQNEIDILCPNDTCYLRELGFIKFKIDEKTRKLKIERAAFYPPFVTWNAARLGAEVAHRILKEHLREIVLKYVDWQRVKEDYFKRLEQARQSSGGGSPESRSS